MSLLADFNKKVKDKYKKTNDSIIFDPNEKHEVIPTGCLSIDTEFDGGLAIMGRLVELSSFECLTGDMMVNIRINQNVKNTSKVVYSV